jgi:hypothetical protein
MPALAALADEHLIRELLDRAEIVVVKTERRHGKSWSEIAIRLHIVSSTPSAYVSRRPDR